MLACASSHGVGGVSRRRGHIFRFAGHVRLEPLTALIVPGGGVRAGAYVRNRARIGHDCGASSRMAAIIGARLSGWAIRRLPRR